MHAPSPWGLLPYDHTDIHQGYSIVDANGKPIAAVKSEAYFESVEQLEATARLLADAPTIYETLHLVLEMALDLVEGETEILEDIQQLIDEANQRWGDLGRR